MKTIKQIIITILLCISHNTESIAQNLNFRPATQRDSLLISIAKEVILKYGPDYYREYQQPIISKEVFPPRGELNPDGIHAERTYYHITFLYDKTEEKLEWDYAAYVRIWEDTGGLYCAMFGNGYGRVIPEGMDWRNDTTIPPVPYQEAIVPLYNINNPDPNQEPVNKDELIRKGWAKRSDGKWVKSGPDVPPASAQIVIKRAQEEMRR